MSILNWFSTKVRLICLIETKGACRYMDSVFIFRAKDFKDAFQKALNLGKSQEKEYMNSDDQKVLWRLKEIISLDLIQADSLDGIEVYSEPIELKEDEVISFTAKFYPEKSQPTQTI